MQGKTLGKWCRSRDCKFYCNEDTMQESLREESQKENRNNFGLCPPPHPLPLLGTIPFWSVLYLIWSIGYLDIRLLGHANPPKTGQHDRTS